MVAAADHQVAEALRRKGFKVLTQGWPDLLVYRERRSGDEPRRVVGLELKRRKDQLRPDQIEMARVFVDLMGVPLFTVRDGELDEVLKRRGRGMLPGRNLHALRQDIQHQRKMLRELDKEAAKVQRELEATSVVFDAVLSESEVRMREVMQRIEDSMWRVSVAESEAIPGDYRAALESVRP